jgi:DNA-binding transcriptional ArsR family regulator
MPHRTLGLTYDEHTDRAVAHFRRAYRHLNRLSDRTRLNCDEMLRLYEAGLVAAQRFVGEVEAAGLEVHKVHVWNTRATYQTLEYLLRSARDRLRSRCFRPPVAIDEYKPHLESSWRTRR